MLKTLLDWLGRLGASDNAPVQLDEREALIAESQELGRQSDAIREKRRAIRDRIDEINAQKISADKG